MSARTALLHPSIEMVHLPYRLAAAIRIRLYRAFQPLLDPYRPELHYMRGPGPRWHAKHGAQAIIPPVQATSD